MALDPNKTITQYSVQVSNMESGLPGNSVFAIRQTQDGFLWIGTQDGLVRFDGLNFELYTRGKIPQLKDNVIRALYEDRDGTLWIGTTSGGLTRYREGEFFTYPITEHSDLSRIIAINQDRWGNLWIGSFTGGLTSLRNGKFTTYTTKQGLPHNQVRNIYKDGNGDLWVTTAAGIVKLLEPGSFQVYASQDLLPFLKTVSLYKEETKELWIGTGERGLFRLKNGMVKAYGNEAGIPHLVINSLFEDRMKNLWIGTDGGGLTRMRDGVSITLPGGDGLASGFVYSIYEDREGSLWVGTLDGGLHQLRDNKFTTYTTREGLVHDITNCIYEDRGGSLWIGTKGGLNVLGLKKGTSTTILTTRQGLLNNSVKCLFEDPSGYLWIGTWGGLHRFKDGNLTTLTKKHGLSNNRIKCILGDREGNTWVGTENGLNQYNNNNGQFTTFSTKQGLSSNFIEFIFEESRGTLWIGTDSGLNCLRDGVITTYNPGSGIENNFFRCAYEDHEGVLWFGSDNGLTRLKEKETTFYSYNVQCGLVENYIYSILEDERGYLWLAGRNGISRVRKKELEDFSKGLLKHVQPDPYNEQDGMKSRWCTGSACKTRDGRFWFPTSVGVTMIDPNNIKKNDLPPPLIIKKLIVDGESFIIKSFCGVQGRFLQKEPLAAGGTLELAPGKKRLEFYYTTVSFINPQKIKFKSRLEGYDSDWINMENARSTTYTGLSPGHYTFKVTACNPDGVWNETGASFSFYLEPYFYQTYWFYLLVGLFVFLAVFSLHRFRVKQLRVRERELRLKEMDKIKSRFFANISHEFRTPITLIMGPLEQMSLVCRDKEEQKKINMMLRNSRRLLNLINQLLDLSKFESGKMQLQAVRQNIVPFLKGIVNSFDSLIVQNDLDLTFLCDEEDITLYYNVEKMEKAVNNVLINAIKFTPPGGSITVTVTVHIPEDSKISPQITQINTNFLKKSFRKAVQQEFLEVSEPFCKKVLTRRRHRNYPSGYVEISVKDTGIGIPEGKLYYIFDRFYQAEGLTQHEHKGSGIGLALTRELVKLHHGEITVHSEEGKGSEFIIRLPLGKEHLKPGEILERSESAAQSAFGDQGAFFKKTLIGRGRRPPPPGPPQKFLLI